LTIPFLIQTFQQRQRNIIFCHSMQSRMLYIVYVECKRSLIECWVQCNNVLLIYRYWYCGIELLDTTHWRYLLVRTAGDERQIIRISDGFSEICNSIIDIFPSQHHRMIFLIKFIDNSKLSITVHLYPNLYIGYSCMKFALYHTVLLYHKNCCVRGDIPTVCFS
jgi:hypothetical protein